MHLDLHAIELSRFDPVFIRLIKEVNGDVSRITMEAIQSCNSASLSGSNAATLRNPS